MITTAEITLVDLPPMQVARFLFFGTDPASDGLAAVQAWAERHGLLEGPQPYPLFGTRTSQPIVSDPQYGYAFLVGIDPALAEELGVDVLELPGGRYATTRCYGVGAGEEAVVQAGWSRLTGWLGAAPYMRDDRPALERFYPPATAVTTNAFDLYLPIVRLPQENGALSRAS